MRLFIYLSIPGLKLNHVRKGGPHVSIWATQIFEVIQSCPGSFHRHPMPCNSLHILQAYVEYHTQVKHNLSIYCCQDDIIKWKHIPRYWSFGREFTGHRWIPLTKASDGELLCFLWFVHEQMVEQTIETPVIWDAIALIMTSCNGNN